MDGLSTHDAQIYRQRETYPNQPVSRLKLLLGSLIIVDERKPCGTTTTKDSAQTKGYYTALLRLVQLRKFLGKFSL